MTGDDQRELTLLCLSEYSSLFLVPRYILGVFGTLQSCGATKGKPSVTRICMDTATFYYTPFTKRLLYSSRPHFPSRFSWSSQASLRSYTTSWTPSLSVGHHRSHSTVSLLFAIKQLSDKPRNCLSTLLTSRQRFKVVAEFIDLVVLSLCRGVV